MENRLIYCNLDPSHTPTLINDVAIKLDKVLHEDWEIYVEPFLNGCNPNILLLHQERGFHVIECQDDIKQALSRLEFIKYGLRTIYCPDAFINDNGQRILTHTYFSVAQENTQQFIEKKIRNAQDFKSRTTAIGTDSYNGNLSEVIPLTKDEAEYSFNAKSAIGLRCWLRPSEYRLDTKGPLPHLDTRQKEIADRSDSGFTKLSGSAGSGKTVVLAYKTAKLIADGKKVLLLVLNKTLLNFIATLIERFYKDLSHKPQRGNYQVLWFHMFAAQHLYSKGWDSNYFNLISELKKEKNSDEVLDNKVPSLLSECIKREGLTETDCFDAILIDEGQDFFPLWLEQIKKFLKPDGHGCFVYDFAQDIYGRSNAWPNGLKGSGLNPGRPNLLKISYRLPRQFIPHLELFVEMFPEILNDKNITENELPYPDPQQDLISKCTAKWYQLNDDDANDEKTIEVILQKAPLEDKNFAYSSLLFLASNNDKGKILCNKLESKDISVAHTFSKIYAEHHAQKINFNLLNNPIKATSIASAKGLESSCIVLQISNNTDPKKVYTSLTRLKMGFNSECSIYVICSDPRYKKFGESWSNI